MEGVAFRSFQAKRELARGKDVAHEGHEPRPTVDRSLRVKGRVEGPIGSDHNESARAAPEHREPKNTIPQTASPARRARCEAAATTSGRDWPPNDRLRTTARTEAASVIGGPG